MQFYENYSRLCAKAGKSLSAVARELGLQKSTVSRWSKGAEPRGTTLIRIADYFGITVAELVGDEAIDADVNELPSESEPAEEGLEAALEALRNQPGRRALLSATKDMTEAQVLRFADWLDDITGRKQ